jgi:hypothetical protein
MQIRLSIVALFALVVTIAAAEPKNGLGTKIIAFSKVNLGKQVGGGECAHLASEALKESGGEPRAKDNPGEGDYVWGQLVVTLEAGDKGAKWKGAITDLKPGDIIQFRDAKFEGQRGKGTYFQTAPHHTAVVRTVDAANKVVKVYEQNVGGQRVVLEGEYRLSDLKAGWLRVYRAESK